MNKKPELPSAADLIHRLALELQTLFLSEKWQTANATAAEITALATPQDDFTVNLAERNVQLADEIGNLKAELARYRAAKEKARAIEPVNIDELIGTYYQAIRADKPSFKSGTTNQVVADAERAIINAFQAIATPRAAPMEPEGTRYFVWKRHESPNAVSVFATADAGTFFHSCKDDWMPDTGTLAQCVAARNSTETDHAGAEVALAGKPKSLAELRRIARVATEPEEPADLGKLLDAFEAIIRQHVASTETARSSTQYRHIMAAAERLDEMDVSKVRETIVKRFMETADHCVGVRIEGLPHGKTLITSLYDATPEERATAEATANTIRQGKTWLDGVAFYGHCESSVAGATTRPLLAYATMRWGKDIAWPAFIEPWHVSDCEHCDGLPAGHGRLKQPNSLSRPHVCPDGFFAELTDGTLLVVDDDDEVVLVRRPVEVVRQNVGEPKRKGGDVWCARYADKTIQPGDEACRPRLGQPTLAGRKAKPGSIVPQIKDCKDCWDCMTEPEPEVADESPVGPVWETAFDEATASPAFVAMHNVVQYTAIETVEAAKVWDVLQDAIRELEANQLSPIADLGTSLKAAVDALPVTLRADATDAAQVLAAAGQPVLALRLLVSVKAEVLDPDATCGDCGRFRTHDSGHMFCEAVDLSEPSVQPTSRACVEFQREPTEETSEEITTTGDSIGDHIADLGRQLAEQGSVGKAEFLGGFAVTADPKTSEEPEPAKARFFRGDAVLWVCGDTKWYFRLDGEWYMQERASVANINRNHTEITEPEAVAILTKADWPNGLAKLRELLGEEVTDGE